MKSEITKSEIDEIFNESLEYCNNGLLEQIICDLSEIINAYSLGLEGLDDINRNIKTDLAVQNIIEAYKLLYQIYKDGK